MKKNESINRLTTLAVLLLLAASVVYHLQQALGTRKENPLPLRGDLRFPGLGGNTLLPSFPLLVATGQVFNHHKTI